MCDLWGDGHQEMESTQTTQMKSKTQTLEEEKTTPVRMTEVEKRRREERGSCTVRGCGWWDVSLEHERADILMESIIHAKWVTGWVSYFHATRHKVPSISLSLKVQLSAALFPALVAVITLIGDIWTIEKNPVWHAVSELIKLWVTCLGMESLENTDSDSLYVCQKKAHTHRAGSGSSRVLLFKYKEVQSESISLCKRPEYHVCHIEVAYKLYQCL